MSSNNINKINLNKNKNYDTHIGNISREINEFLLNPVFIRSVEPENPHFNLCKTDKIYESLRAVLCIADINYLKSSIDNTENIKIYISQKLFNIFLIISLEKFFLVFLIKVYMNHMFY